MHNQPIEIEPQDVPYVLIHEDILADERLSYKARGILAYLLSRHGRWQVRFYDLVNHSKRDGKTAIQGGLAELVRFGYARLQAYRTEDGTRFAGKRYVILKYKPLPKTYQESNSYSDNQVFSLSENQTVRNTDSQETALYTNSSEGDTKSKKEDTKPKEEEKNLFVELPKTYCEGREDGHTEIIHTTLEALSQDHSQSQDRLVRLEDTFTNDSSLIPTRNTPHSPEEQPPPLQYTQTKDLSPPPSHGAQAEDTVTPSQLIDMYNALTPDSHPKVQRKSPARLELARQYLKGFPERSFWETVFANISGSPFLQGQKNGNGHKSFVANFDWLLSKGKDKRIENCLKVAEGVYNEKGSTTPRGSDHTATRARFMDFYANTNTTR